MSNEKINRINLNGNEYSVTDEELKALKYSAKLARFPHKKYSKLVVINPKNHKLTQRESWDEGNLIQLEILSSLGVEFADEGIDIEEQATNNVLVSEMLKTLTPDEHYIIMQFFFEGKTEEEIAKDLSVSQQAVHAKKGRILLKLRKRFS